MIGGVVGDTLFWMALLLDVGGGVGLLSAVGGGDFGGCCPGSAGADDGCRV